MLQIMIMSDIEFMLKYYRREYEMSIKELLKVGWPRNILKVIQ